MLIIFDLDDTLIDTTGSLTPLKLERAVYKMSEQGLVLPDLERAIQTIKHLDETSLSARHTLMEFLEINQADSRFLQIGLQEVYENFSYDFSVFPLDGVIETLEELKLEHTLALVTMGKQEHQLEKMKKAGIDTTVFSKIIVCGEPNKKIHYEAIVSELCVRPSDVFVCGDRIATDLIPARELGLKTIHMRSGRGMNSTGSQGDVDFAITRLSEIKEIVGNS